MNLEEYAQFVAGVTSDRSEHFEAFMNSAWDLQKEVQVSLLLTGAIGLASETGEFNEIVKKTLFQGKPLDKFHMKRELGDIIWYWVNACRALGFTPQEVIDENVTKLDARYAGEFSVNRSENRVEGDL